MPSFWALAMERRWAAEEGIQEGGRGGDGESIYSWRILPEMALASAAVKSGFLVKEEAICSASRRWNPSEPIPRWPAVSSSPFDPGAAAPATLQAVAAAGVNSG